MASTNGAFRVFYTALPCALVLLPASLYASHPVDWPDVGQLTDWEAGGVFGFRGGKTPEKRNNNNNNICLLEKNKQKRNSTRAAEVPSNMLVFVWKGGGAVFGLGMCFGEHVAAYAFLLTGKQKHNWSITWKHPLRMFFLPLVWFCPGRGGRGVSLLWGMCLKCPRST